MRKKLILTGALFLAFFTAGCVTQHAPSANAESPSILADTQSREDLAQRLQNAGVSQDKQDVFFSHVDQFNEILTPEELTKPFDGDPLKPLYDPYSLQERWDSAHPDFFGYNCRITAYSLFGDFVTVPQDAPIREDSILFDLSSLDADPSAFPGQEQQFAAFYSNVPTENTRDIGIHAANLQKAWQQRGIVFTDDPDIRLISVVFHNLLDEANPSLFIGHTGVLLPVSDQELYFVEKLAFQEPYLYLRFDSRQALNDYLMEKYDVDFDQPNAAPFIMENDQLMEGYRALPKDN